MLWEYKIQKIEDGNGDESFSILMHRVGSDRWWKKKQWIVPTTYDLDKNFYSLGKAQSAVKAEMKKDARTEFKSNKDKTRVVKEFYYTDIPNHIPEEQEERFCDLKGVEIETV